MNTHRENPCCPGLLAMSWIAGLGAIATGMLLLSGSTSDASQQGKKSAKQPTKPYESGIVWAEPQMVTPGTHGSAPSDAIVLFDGKNMNAWTGGDKWTLENGVGTAKSAVSTRQKFGDCQLHVEFATPKEVKGNGQGRGNNGIGFMGAQYEVQVLDSWKNPTYFDGQCAALYKQRPPLVNASRPPGEWQTYDIVFEAPRFKGDKLERPAYETVILNGVLLHNHQASLGPMVYRKLAHYEPHAAELPLMLQDHNTPVHYRNIWIRKIGNYDEPER